MKSVTGLPTSSSPPTTQSRPFFKVPGTPCAYSGTENTKPSAARRQDLQSFTDCGAVSPSRSGLKCGRSPSPLYRDTSTPCGTTAIAAFRSAVFEEEARRLPEIARIRIRQCTFDACLSDRLRKRVFRFSRLHRVLNMNGLASRRTQRYSRPTCNFFIRD